MLLQQKSAIAIVIYPFSFIDGQLFTNSYLVSIKTNNSSALNVIGVLYEIVLRFEP